MLPRTPWGALMHGAARSSIEKEAQLVSQSFICEIINIRGNTCDTDRIAPLGLQYHGAVMSANSSARAAYICLFVCVLLPSTTGRREGLPLHRRWAHSSERRRIGV